MNYASYISDKLYIVSIVLFFVGLFLKKTPNVKNWSIPYILSAFGIIACFIIDGLSFSSFLQGLLSAGVAVYVHQLGKQCIGCTTEQSEKILDEKNVD